MNAHNRAMVKTAITIFTIVVLVAICFVWPLLFGWIVTGIFACFMIFFIYLLFKMYEDTVEWRKRD